MIFEGSRYETATVAPALGDDGEYHPTVIPRLPPPVPEVYGTYRVQHGDRFDLIAARAYGDPEMWWRIADANPEFFAPDELPAGVVIRIPSYRAGDR